MTIRRTLHRGCTGAAALALALATTLVGITATAPPAGATTAHVTTEAALRTALADAAVTHIDVDLPISASNCVAGSQLGTFVRANVGGDLTIDGHGNTITQTCANSHVFFFGNSNQQKFTLAHITLTGVNIDNTTCALNGGAVLAGPGPLVLDHAILTGNSVTASSGACGASGGAVNASGAVTVLFSTIANNQVSCASCTPSNGFGGAGIATSGAVSLVDSTVTNNTIGSVGTGHGYGGGLQAQSVSLLYSTVTENAASFSASNIYTSGGMTSFGSVVAIGIATSNCVIATGTVSHGYNFEDANTCGFNGGTDFPNGGSPQIDPLGPNGGPTGTRPPSSGASPLVDKIPSASCSSNGAENLVTDQRDFVRPEGNGAACDIGAVERHPGGLSGTFTSVPPDRILDTRSNVGLNGAFTPQQTRNLHVVGVGFIPAANVEAIVLNVTATAPTAAGWLTLFPTGSPLPTASNLNFTAGQTVPNLVEVKVGNAGNISINNTGGNPASGTTHVIADVVGYYGDSNQAPASKFTAIAANRILDTRSNVGLTRCVHAEPAPRPDRARRREPCPRDGISCGPERHRDGADSGWVAHPLPDGGHVPEREQPQLPRRPNRAQPRRRQGRHER